MPVPQEVQVAAPRLAEDVPAAQSMQYVEPVDDAYLPAAHRVHEPTPPSEKEPAAQDAQVEAPAALYFPTAHDMQAVRPAVAYFPASQELQDEEPEETENFPVPQVSQTLYPEEESVSWQVEEAATQVQSPPHAMLPVVPGHSAQVEV